MRRSQSVIIVAVLLLAVFAGAWIGSVQPSPAHAVDTYTPIYYATPQVPVIDWR